MATKIEKTDDQWREELTPEQYEVLRKGGTERAFTGQYWNAHEDGVYRCAGCGAELFDSATKFDSGTGWPSFTEPKVAEASRCARTSRGACAARRSSAATAAGTWATSSRTARAQAGGMRYCMNSCSLDFQAR